MYKPPDLHPLTSKWYSINTDTNRKNVLLLPNFKYRNFWQYFHQACLFPLKSKIIMLPV